MKGCYILGDASKKRFDTLHPVLKVLVLTILDRMDVTVVCGYRGQNEQDEAYNNGKSSVKFPNSKHNKNPSLAVDIAPFIRGKGVRWNSAEVSHMQGRIAEIAEYLGVPIRWGGDWDSDGDIVEHSLNDYVHLEINLEEVKKTTWRYLE